MVRKQVPSIWGDGKKRQSKTQDHQAEGKAEGEDLSKEYLTAPLRGKEPGCGCADREE